MLDTSLGATGPATLGIAMVTLGLIAYIDNRFADNHAIAERYNPRARLKPRVDDETGY